MGGAEGIALARCGLVSHGWNVFAGVTPHFYLTSA
jgi:hypothetical protein